MRFRRDGSFGERGLGGGRGGCAGGWAEWGGGGVTVGRRNMTNGVSLGAYAH